MKFWCDKTFQNFSVDRFLKIFDSPPHFTKNGVCGNIDIWQTPSALPYHVHYTGSQNDGPQNQKWNWASFDQYIKIYFNKNTHNFEMTEPKQCLKKCIKVSNYVFTWVEVAWITIISFGKSNFILMKTKQNRQNLQVSAILVQSKKALGCLISKLCTMHSVAFRKFSRFRDF